jgi:hypothetical protein
MEKNNIIKKIIDKNKELQEKIKNSEWNVQHKPKN